MEGGVTFRRVGDRFPFRRIRGTQLGNFAGLGGRFADTCLGRIITLRSTRKQEHQRPSAGDAVRLKSVLRLEFLDCDRGIRTEIAIHSAGKVTEGLQLALKRLDRLYILGAFLQEAEL